MFSRILGERRSSPARVTTPPMLHSPRRSSREREPQADRAPGAEAHSGGEEARTSEPDLEIGQRYSIPDEHRRSFHRISNSSRSDRSSLVTQSDTEQQYKSLYEDAEEMLESGEYNFSLFRHMHLYSLLLYREEISEKQRQLHGLIYNPVYRTRRRPRSRSRDEHVEFVSSLPVPDQVHQAKVPTNVDRTELDQANSAFAATIPLDGPSPEKFEEEEKEKPQDPISASTPDPLTATPATEAQDVNLQEDLKQVDEDRSPNAEPPLPLPGSSTASKAPSRRSSGMYEQRLSRRSKQRLSRRIETTMAETRHLLSRYSKSILLLRRGLILTNP